MRIHFEISGGLGILGMISVCKTNLGFTQINELLAEVVGGTVVDGRDVWMQALEIGGVVIECGGSSSFSFWHYGLCWCVAVLASTWYLVRGVCQQVGVVVPSIFMMIKVEAVPPGTW